MRGGQNAVLESHRRAQSFLDDNADALKDVNTSTRKQLDDVEQSLAGRSTHLNRRAGATLGLIAAEKRGRTMRRVLNAPVVTTTSTPVAGPVELAA